MPRGPGHFVSVPAEVKNRRGTVRRLWQYLAHYRAALAGVAVLVVLSSALVLMAPYLIGRTIDMCVAKAGLRPLARMMGLMLLVQVLTSAAFWLQTVGAIVIAQQAGRDIRRDLFDHMQTLSLRFFDGHPHGELMSRLTNDTDTVTSTMGDCVTQLVNCVLMVAGAAVIMCAMNWRLAIATMATVPLVTAATAWLGAKTRQGYRDRQQSLGTLNGIVEETIHGQRVVKVCQREQDAIRKFSAANAELRRCGIKAVMFIGFMGPAMGVCRNLGFAVLAGTGGWLVTRGLATIGTVAAFVNYADQFNRPLNQIANLYGMVQSALAGAERVFAIMDEPPEAEDASGGTDLTNVRGDVEFQNVSFGYKPDATVLKEITFRAPAGQTTALVGPTGAGKTTIINLLTRFYDVDKGCIRVDGQDIRELRRDSLRRSLGIVLQDTVLFTGTVRDNIRYGRLEATDAEVEAAARLANADQFIRHLPAGYDTQLSDSGSSLSQGQRQLLAIARAMLADPAILILDEATSSVDTRTEIHVQEAMQRLLHGRTSFIIAHRLSTIRKADCIMVIEDGRIVERGNHADLLARQGAYHRLYTSQFATPA